VTQIVEPERSLLETDGSGYEGAGYVTLRIAQAGPVFKVRVAVPGWYLIDARYANGNGAVSYGYRAAARALEVDGRRAGTLLMPQRGGDRWNDWGYTNAIRTWLNAGEHELAIVYRPEYRNMDGVEDRARLDHLRIIRLADAARKPQTRSN
jgi:hypothetical protein